MLAFYLNSVPNVTDLYPLLTSFVPVNVVNKVEFNVHGGTVNE